MTVPLRLAAVIVLSPLTLVACKEDAASPPGEASVPSGAEGSTRTSAVPSEPAAAAPVEVSDACTLLAPDEVSATLGEDVKGVPATSGGVLACTWLRPGHRTLIVQFHKSARRFDDVWQAHQDFYGSEAEPVGDAGEQAFYVGGRTGKTGVANVAARKGGRFVNVQLQTPTEAPEDVKSDALSLARAAVNRI